MALNDTILNVLTGDATFNAAGEYTVTGITITGTAS